jgi:Cactus-binding C-terminus of cactin protein
VASRFVPKAAQPTIEVDETEPVSSGADLASEALYRAEAERDLDEEEELFNLEENIANPTTYNWEDKYRPRKPRYFNRVHTGYEWNKYNQTHYEYVRFPCRRYLAHKYPSTDNPPPKVVQGYKVCDPQLLISHDLTSSISSIFSILISLINQRRQHTRLLRNQGTMKLFSFISVPVLLTRTLHSG